MVAVLSFITSIIYAVYGYYVGKIIFNNKKRSSYKIILTVIISCFFYYYILILLDSIYLTFITSIVLIPLIKNFSDKNILETVTLSLVAYFFVSFIQLIFFFFQSDKTLESVFNFNKLNNLKIIIIACSILISLVLIFILRKYIKKFISFINRYKYYYIILVILFAFNISISFITKNNIQVSKDSNLDFLVVFSLIIFFIYSIDRNNKLEALNKYYEEIFEYSKISEELNFNYKKKIHENKNHLLLIDSMIGTDDERLKNYLKYLLGISNNKVDNYFLSDLGKIPLPGIKNFINFKLMELHNIDTSVEVFVSEDIKDIDISQINDEDYNDISVVLGVILDNMIDEVKTQSTKLVSVNIFVEDDNMCMQFANNIDRKIDIDKIFTKGYSTKGKNRGVGLSLVSDITANSKIVDCKPNIIDNFFIQDVTVKIPKIIKQ